MASASFSLSRNGDADFALTTGADVVTEGTSAPGAGQLEVRIDLAAGFTKLEIENALDRIWRFLSDVNRSTSIPL